jgi:hypothetical protein
MSQSYQTFFFVKRTLFANKFDRFIVYEFCYYYLSLTTIKIGEIKKLKIGRIDSMFKHKRFPFRSDFAISLKADICFATATFLITALNTASQIRCLLLLINTFGLVDNLDSKKREREPQNKQNKKRQ